MGEGVCSVGKRAAEVYFEPLAQRASVSAKGYIALWKVAALLNSVAT